MRYITASTILHIAAWTLVNSSSTAAVRFYRQTEGYGIVVFNSSSNSSVDGNNPSAVIKTVPLRHEYDCFGECMMEPQCRSFNIALEKNDAKDEDSNGNGEETGGTLVCEMMSIDKCSKAVQESLNSIILGSAHVFIAYYDTIPSDDILGNCPAVCGYFRDAENRWFYIEKLRVKKASEISEIQSVLHVAHLGTHRVNQFCLTADKKISGGDQSIWDGFYLKGESSAKGVEYYNIVEGNNDHSGSKDTWANKFEFMKVEGRANTYVIKDRNRNKCLSTLSFDRYFLVSTVECADGEALASSVFIFVQNNPQSL